MDIKQRFMFSLSFAFVFAIVINMVLKTILPEEALLLSVVFGGLTYILMFVALAVENRINNKKYREVEEQFGDVCFLKRDGYLVTAKKGRCCRIYFCDFGIAFASFDKKPHILHVVKAENILKYQTDMKFLYIYTKNEGMLCFKISNINQIIKAIRDKHWIL